MKKAFTLIELIVVITIIAVLSVVGMVSFSKMNTKARDTRRIQDLQKMAAAAEIYRQASATKKYPATGAFFSTLVPDYLPDRLYGPKGQAAGDTYGYVSTNNGYGYELSAVLEDAKNNPIDSTLTTYILKNP